MVRVVIESELVRTEKELPNSLKLKQFKDRLYHVTGVEPEDMEIVVKRQYDNKEIYSTKKGGAYSNEDEDADFLKGEEELIVVVTDSNAQSISNQLATQAEGIPSMEVISEEDYLRRDQSVLRWKMAHGYGRFNAAQHLPARCAGKAGRSICPRAINGGYRPPLSCHSRRERST